MIDYCLSRENWEVGCELAEMLLQMVDLHVRKWLHAAKIWQVPPMKKNEHQPSTNYIIAKVLDENFDRG